MKRAASSELVPMASDLVAQAVHRFQGLTEDAYCPLSHLQHLPLSPEVWLTPLHDSAVPTSP